MIRFIDWFSGIGGFRLGLEMAGGFECVAHAEIDDYAEAVYQRHWPGSRNLGDIRHIEDVPEADLWCGGFPCQPFSVAGARRGAADDRNLWPLWFNFICSHRPRYILGENVPGLLADRQFGRILADLSSAGYVSEWTVIGARDVGAPHRRDRLWIWATMDDTEGAGRGVRHTADQRAISGDEHASRDASADVAHRDERGREVERVGAVDDGAQRGHADRCGSAGRTRPEQRGTLADTGGGPELGRPHDDLQTGRYAAGGSDSWPPGWTLDPADVEHAQVERWGKGRTEHAVRGGGNAAAESGDAGNTASGRFQEQRGPVAAEPARAGSECPSCGADQGPAPPLLGRVAHGIPDRVDRLRCLGNAVVPQVITWIGQRIQEAVTP